MTFKIKLTPETWFCGLLPAYGEPLETRDEQAALGYSTENVAQVALDGIGGLKRWPDAQIVGSE